MIKAYLFSKIARQIDHTYYSLPDISFGPSKFFYNLKDYEVKNFMLSESFIYEVEIYPETIFICSNEYLKARKYKIVRRVRLKEYLEEIFLPNYVTEELDAIFNCANSHLLEKDFYDLFNQEPRFLSPYEKLKFLAILNRVQGDFPSVIIKKSYQIQYIKLLEFYEVPYDCSKMYLFFREMKKEKIYGSNKFEIINNRTEKLLHNAKISSEYISPLIIGRKLTQQQFEAFCDSIDNLEIWVGRFYSSAIISGYKIQPKHEKQFYPFIVYHNPEKIEGWIKNKLSVDKIDSLIALENNYMIDGVKYWNSNHQKIIEAKKIFLKDDFKIIDRS